MSFGVGVEPLSRESFNVSLQSSSLYQTQIVACEDYHREQSHRPSQGIGDGTWIRIAYRTVHVLPSRIERCKAQATTGSTFPKQQLGSLFRQAVAEGSSPILLHR